LLGVAFYKKGFQRVRWQDGISIVILGLIGVFLNQLSFFIGLETADTTMSALILATTPILTGFLAAIFLHEKLTGRMMMGSVIAIIGIYFLVTEGKFTSLHVSHGLLWIVLTMVTFAIMILMTRFLSQRVAPMTLTLYSNMIAFVASVPFVFIIDQPIQL